MSLFAAADPTFAGFGADVGSAIYDDGLRVSGATGGWVDEVDISNGDFVFSLTEGYLIEDGKLTAPLKGVNLIGNGPDAMRKVTMLGHDFEVSDGIWTCGKDGQSVPVGVGCPTIKIAAMTVGGTQVVDGGLDVLGRRPERDEHHVGILGGVLGDKPVVAAGQLGELG